MVRGQLAQAISSSQQLQGLRPEAMWVFVAAFRALKCFADMPMRMQMFDDEWSVDMQSGKSFDSPACNTACRGTLLTKAS